MSVSDSHSKACLNSCCSSSQLAKAYKKKSLLKKVKIRASDPASMQSPLLLCKTWAKGVGQETKPEALQRVKCPALSSQDVCYQERC